MKPTAHACLCAWFGESVEPGCSGFNSPGSIRTVCTCLCPHACARGCKGSTDRMAERRQCGGKDVLRIAIPRVLKAPAESLCRGAAQLHDSRLVEIKSALQPECARLGAAPPSVRAHLGVREARGDGRTMRGPSYF